MATLKVDVDPSRDHIRGNVDAPVTLVEYGDYECPHCGKAEPVVEAVREAMGDRLRVVFRSFPLSEIHKHAQHASEAAEAASVQGKFWEMHHAIFSHQRSGLSDEVLLGLAAEWGWINPKSRTRWSQAPIPSVFQEDFLSGIRSGVNGTPTFFINGTRFDDSWDEETLLSALQAA